jgi:hypothetical protein
MTFSNGLLGISISVGIRTRRCAAVGGAIGLISFEADLKDHRRGEDCTVDARQGAAAIRSGPRLILEYDL